MRAHSGGTSLIGMTATSPQEPVRLDATDIEAIAVRVAELMRDAPPRPASRFVDAQAVADMLDVDREWVYEHAARLGAIRLGGPRGRLRFDTATLLAQLGPKPDTPLAVQLAGRRARRRRRSGRDR